jgi:hypothetical protein
MPTPESAEAFTFLVATRTRLTEVTKQLSETKYDLPGSSALHASLQADWDAAFSAFELATEAFSASVKHLHDEVESSRSMTAKAT